MAEEPYTPYRIKAPPLQAKEEGPPPKKLTPGVTRIVDFTSPCGTGWI
jgi:hypothetical protein